MQPCEAAESILYIPRTYLVCLEQPQWALSQVSLPANKHTERSFCQAGIRRILAGGVLLPYRTQRFIRSTRARLCSAHCRPPALALGLPRHCSELVAGALVPVGFPPPPGPYMVGKSPCTAPLVGRDGTGRAGRAHAAARRRSSGVYVSFLNLLSRRARPVGMSSRGSTLFTAIASMKA